MADETSLPFVARITGLLGFLLGASYVAGVVFGLGVLGPTTASP